MTPERQWPLLEGGWVEVSGTVRANQLELRLELAKQHLGIALLLENAVVEGLANGALVRVLPDRIGRPVRVALVYPDREFLEPKVRSFVDFISARIAASRAARGIPG